MDYYYPISNECVNVWCITLYHIVYSKKKTGKAGHHGVSTCHRLHFIFKAISQPISSLEHLGRARKCCCWTVGPRKISEMISEKILHVLERFGKPVPSCFPGPGDPPGRIVWPPGDPQELPTPTMPPTQFSSKSARCTTRPALFGERVGLLTASHHLKNPQQNQLFCSSRSLGHESLGHVYSMCSIKSGTQKSSNF